MRPQDTDTAKPRRPDWRDKDKLKYLEEQAIPCAEHEAERAAKVLADLKWDRNELREKINAST